MKFMKLGSRPDSFQSEGDDIRYVASELAADMVINIGDMKFYLHKFPLLSKSARLQKLVANTNDTNVDEIYINDIPGGQAAFQICAKFCYGMVVTLNAYNVVAARCASEYLEMFETVEKGNLIYKIDIFLNSSIFKSWKDSIIVLQSTRSLLPYSEELKVVNHCLDSIASKASIETSKVEWSYTYNRKKLPSENGNNQSWDHSMRKSLSVIPIDWWVEDLCELHIDLYKQVITAIMAKGKVSDNVIGEALNAYALTRLPCFKTTIQSGGVTKYKSLVETIIWLLPSKKGSVACGFMLKLLRASILLECEKKGINFLIHRIGPQLHAASIPDLLIPTQAGETSMHNVDIVQSLVEEFSRHLVEEEIFVNGRESKFGSNASKIAVAKLIDGYLTEISRDPYLPLSKFLSLAEMVSRFPRSSHDGLYRAIDMYLKEHSTTISKNEKKKLCRLMNCQKLSLEAQTHAVQNERLPLRVVVQLLFFEQTKHASNSAGNISHGSSRSITANTEDDWETVATAEDIKALKGEFASLRLASHVGETKKATAAMKANGMLVSKMFSRLWSNKERNGEISSTDTSESPGSGSGSVTADETKSTPSQSGKHTVSN